MPQMLMLASESTTMFVSAQPSLSEAEAKRERLLQELAVDDDSDALEGMDAAPRSCGKDGANDSADDTHHASTSADTAKPQRSEAELEA
eukprot:71035-Pleurochrysis_carterae.AAC.1